jgi:putative addiction module killer protein
MELEEYLDGEGESPFGAWFNDLDATAAARVTIAMARMEAGNLSNTKGVGAGVLEYRIDTGPGYRVYFGRDGETLIILLAGGTKRRQQKDIEAAQERWADYKRRKRGS